MARRRYRSSRGSRASSLIAPAGSTRLPETSAEQELRKSIFSLIKFLFVQWIIHLITDKRGRKR